MSERHIITTQENPILVAADCRCNPLQEDLCEQCVRTLRPSDNWATLVDWNIANYQIEFEALLAFYKHLDDNCESFDSLTDSFVTYTGTSDT